MATRTTINETDEDVRKLGRAFATMRERLGVKQDAAAAAAQPPMSMQYWSMHETGRVPGIRKAARQLQMLAALSNAAQLDPPLTLQDLEQELKGDEPESRMARMARELVGAQGDEPGVKRAVFPTREGDVVFTFPAGMGPAGFKDLERYFAVFLATRAET